MWQQFKITICLIAMGLVSLFASEQSLAALSTLKNPIYISLDAGYSTVNYTNALLAGGLIAGSIGNNGIAPRIAFGFDFNRYVGLEFGIIYMKKPQFKNFNMPVRKPTDGIIKNNMIFFLAKFSLPMTKYISAYIKAGYGYIARNGIFLLDGTTALPENNYNDAIYGAGFVYQLNDHWAVNTTWMQAPRRSSVRLPTSNFYGAGFIYKFRW